MILEHAEWLLFAWVFSNQAGVPVPVVPALIGAGALAGSGHRRMAVMIGIAVGASLAADLMWYSLGRWHGTGMLRMLARLAPNGRLLVRRARGLFLAHVRVVQFGARFLPELNAIASGLAGASSLSVTRFVCYGAASALVWAGAWMGLGYVLSQPVTETAAYLGIRLIVPFLAIFALYLPFQRVRRHRLFSAFRQVRSEPIDREARLESDDAATILLNHAKVASCRGAGEAA